MGKLRGKLLFLRGKFREYINAHDIWLSRCPLRGGAHRHVCPAYAQYSAQYTQVARVSLRGGSSERRTMSNTTPEMEALATAFAQTLVSMLPAMLTQPAQTVTQAVTTVATQASEAAANIYGEAGFPYLSKVKLPALKKAGVIPYGTTVKQALEAGLMDNTRVDPAIATQAPSAGTTVTATKAKLSAGDIKRMNRAQLAQHISRKDLIALL